MCMRVQHDGVHTNVGGDMIHIAYIESDKHSQFTFEQIVAVLQARGIESQLTIYASPAEALDEIPFERPDIIFLDLRTHNGRKPSGLELARVLRQHPLCRNIILVAVTDYAMPADRSAALAAGCHEFLPKPIRYQSVEETITTLLLVPQTP
jgi:CheY-like chemotaxis protein